MGLNNNDTDSLLKVIPTQYQGKACIRHTSPLCPCHALIHEMYTHAEVTLSRSKSQYQQTDRDNLITSQLKNNHRKVFKQTLLTHFHVNTY